MTQQTRTEELQDLVQTMEHMQAIRDDMPDRAWQNVEEDEELQAVLDGHRDDWEKVLVINMYMDMLMADLEGITLNPKHVWLLPYMDMARNYGLLVHKSNKRAKKAKAKRSKNK